MRTILFLLIVSGFQDVFGQLISKDYEIFSDVLSQLEKNRINDRFLVSDSTMPFSIGLSDIEPYIRVKTDKNLKLAKDIFPYHDLLNEIWADSSVYDLIVSHNAANRKVEPITQRFRKKLMVDIFDSKNDNHADFWDLLYKLYPASGGIRTFSHPAIVGDRAVVILEWMQAGNAGETILLLMRQSKDVWIMDKTFVLGGE